MLRIGFNQKARSNSQYKPRKYFCTLHQSTSDFNDNEPYFNGFLRLNSWNFVILLRLVNMSGNWDSASHVNWPLFNYFS